MGTNYYVIVNPCEHCGRREKLHIGKSSAGWEFQFREHRDRFPILASKIEWEEFTKDKAIEDEYGAKPSYQAFWDMVNLTREWRGINHTDYCKANHPAYFESGGVFKDNDGWSFSESEFS